MWKIHWSSTLPEEKNPVNFFIESAEAKANERMAAEEELRHLRSQLLQVKAEVIRNESKLHEYRGYRRFLESLIPEPQKSERAAILESKRAERRHRHKIAEHEDFWEKRRNASSLSMVTTTRVP